MSSHFFSTIQKMECANLGKHLTCKEKNGHQFWSVQDEPESETACPDHSLPWRMDALCNLKDETKCYKKRIDSKEIGICVVPTGDAKLTTQGEAALEIERLIENNVPITDPSYFEGMEACTRHTMEQMENASIITWVPKGEDYLCENIMKETSTFCDTNEDCKFEHLYADTNHNTYECILDTSRIKDISTIASKPNTFPEWIRDNKYACKSDGFYCHDSNLSEYDGGNRCIIKDDCHDNSEFGICDVSTRSCTVGSSKNSNCTQDEDCDILKPLEGHCSDNKCVKGKSGIDVAYYKPLECDPSQKKYAHSVHQYCGEYSDGKETYYTGTCEFVNDRSFQACKPFKTDEIAGLQLDEMTKARNAGTLVENFYRDPPPWEKLAECPPNHKIDVNGREICLLTMEKVEAHLGTVDAIDPDHAQQKCQATFGTRLPILALPKY